MDAVGADDERRRLEIHGEPGGQREHADQHRQREPEQRQRRTEQDDAVGRGRGHHRESDEADGPVAISIQLDLAMSEAPLEVSEGDVVVLPVDL